MRVSRISSLKKNRIRSNYVNRINNPDSVSKIEPIDPTSNIQNNSSYSSENHLMAYDAYYDNVKQLKEEFKKFYHDKLALKEAIHSLNQNNSQKCLIVNMSQLVEKYNQTILSLKLFDLSTGNHNMSKIKEILTKYENHLGQLGISLIDDDTQMVFNQQQFLKKLQENNDPLDNIFSPVTDLLTVLFSTLRTIRIPHQNEKSRYLKKEDYRGLYFDNKG